MFTENELISLLHIFESNPRLRNFPHVPDFGECNFGVIGGGEVTTDSFVEFLAWMLFGASHRWNCYLGRKRSLLRQIQALLYLMLEFPGEFAAVFLPGRIHAGNPIVSKLWDVLSGLCKNAMHEFDVPQELLGPNYFVQTYASPVEIQKKRP